MKMLVLWLKVGGRDQQLSPSYAKNEMLVKVDKLDELPSTLPA